MIFGLYLLSPPVLTDEQQQQLLLDAAGNLKTVSAGSGATADQVQGTAASGAAATGNPVRAGARYNVTQPTVTDGQAVDLQADATGNLMAVGKTLSGAWSDARSNTIVAPANKTNSEIISLAYGFGFNGTTWDRARGDTNGTVVQSALSSTFWNYAAAASGITNTTTAVTIKAAAGASVRNYLKSLTIGHDTLGAATEVAIRDGAAGTVLWRGRLQTTAKEDVAIYFDPPLKGTANTLMEVVTLTAVTGGVYVNASGYTGA